MVGVGPNADGQFHTAVIERLEYAGRWLKVNGEAIYATRPWRYWKEGDTIRYTRSKDGKYVYAIALSWPGRQLKLSRPRAKAGSKIVLLGASQPLGWRQDSAHLTITIPDHLQHENARPCLQAWAFRIEIEPTEAQSAKLSGDPYIVPLVVDVLDLDDLVTHANHVGLQQPVPSVLEEPGVVNSKPFRIGL